MYNDVYIHTDDDYNYYAYTHAGLIERPVNTKVEIGERVTFTCTYRSTEPQQNININFINSPPINTSLYLRSIDRFTHQGTLSFPATSGIAAVSRGYECIVTVGSDTVIISETATLTISCKYMSTIT